MEKLSLYVPGAVAKMAQVTPNIPQEQQALLSEIVGYFQNKMTQDVVEMTDHIVNTVNASNKTTVEQLNVTSFELEKLHSLSRIQHLTLYANNVLMKTVQK